MNIVNLKVVAVIVVILLLLTSTSYAYNASVNSNDYTILGSVYMPQYGDVTDDNHYCLYQYGGESHDASYKGYAFINPYQWLVGQLTKTVVSGGTGYYDEGRPDVYGTAYVYCENKYLASSTIYVHGSIDADY